MTMKEEDKILPYDLSMDLKNLEYNEYSEWMYETSRFHNGKELGSDEEFELRCEGKPYEIKYVPGGCLNKYCVRNDLDWLPPDACSAPYINDVVDWLEEQHNVLVVVRPEFENGLRKPDEYDNEARYGVVFANKWTVNVYHVGNVIGTVGSKGDEQVVTDDLICQVDMDYYYKSFDSRFKAATYGIELALNHYVKKEDGTDK